MNRTPELPSQEAAIEQGLSFYGAVEEADTEEGAGTRVSIIPVGSESAMLSGVTERQYFLTRRGYEKSVRKDIRLAARYIGRNVLR